MAGMKEAMAWQRVEAARQDEGSRQQLVKAGMTFTPITPQGRADFRRSTASVVESLKKRIDPKLIDAVVTEASK